jgi:putative ABC transport system ATP-binding protein
MNTVIDIKKLTKTFHMGSIAVHALRGIDLEVKSGEFVAIMGASGSGKSTLMNLLGCLDKPTTGEYFLDGVRVDELSGNDFATIRNEKIGFVFQTFNLLPRTSAIENVMLPLFYDRRERIKNPRRAAVEALTRVGLAERLDHEPNQLSGGQQQRVAIARALVNQPAIVLADEPTGNLDSRTSVEVLSVFQELNNQGITIILVTHERDIAAYTRRIVELRDGLVRRDEPVLKRRDAKADLAAMPVDEMEEQEAPQS